MNRRPQPRKRDAQGRPLLPNGQVDEAPDCYTVERRGEGVFHVKHFLDPDDTHPCCESDVARVEADLEVARRDNVGVDVVTLRRAPDCVRVKAAMAS